MFVFAFAIKDNVLMKRRKGAFLFVRDIIGIVLTSLEFVAATVISVFYFIARNTAIQVLLSVGMFVLGILYSIQRRKVHDCYGELIAKSNIGYSLVTFSSAVFSMLVLFNPPYLTVFDHVIGIAATIGIIVISVMITIRGVHLVKNTSHYVFEDRLIPDPMDNDEYTTEVSDASPYFRQNQKFEN